MPVLCLLSLISRNSPKQLGMVSPELLDRKARREAERMGLRVTGLLGILAEARDRGLIDAEVIVERLTMTSFRASRDLIAAVLRPER